MAMSGAWRALRDDGSLLLGASAVASPQILLRCKDALAWGEIPLLPLVWVIAGGLPKKSCFRKGVYLGLYSAHCMVAIMSEFLFCSPVQAGTWKPNTFRYSDCHCCP